MKLLLNKAISRTYLTVEEMLLKGQTKIKKKNMYSKILRRIDGSADDIAFLVLNQNLV